METEKNLVTISVLKSGPYLVKGPVKLINADGKEEVKESAHLCRCGGSANKPSCDGSHVKLGFEK
ncbi:MAG: CDGSH iron-sulfur domain-containing protein [Bacteroidales bacterium]|nr:CDGSH iron-sulfur domain-containing protein [Bacteroidales bacterium]